MRFGTQLAYAQVPEWSQQYIDYDKLKEAIVKTSEDALALAKAYDAVLRLTGVVVDNDINLLQLSSEGKFFTLLENEVSKAEKFYRDRIVEMVENFYLLVQSAIEQGLIENFRYASLLFPRAPNWLSDI